MARSNKRDLRRGLVYDKAAFTWITPEEMARRDAVREERIFLRQRNQGELCTPYVISDSMPAVKSMLDGEMYDSKSRLRRTYKDADMTEVGNDSSMTPEGIASTYAPHAKPKTQSEKDAATADVRASVEAAFSQVNLTSYRHEEL